MTDGTSSRRRRRLWRFGAAELDEASWTLRVAGKLVALEAKPLAVLHELLLRAGEVVTKDELLDSVWTGVTVVEGSLATAVSKLRRALGDESGGIVETVPRIGYRVTSTVTIESIDAPLTPRFAFASGDTVPGRKQWLLEAPLGDSGAQDVWRAAHAKTGERRVFKFADTPDRLRALKREAALTRLIASALGSAAPAVRLFEWNFEAAPYFLELSWGGEDLLHWAEQAGGVATIDRAQRLAVAVAICRAVEAVHGIGVLHKDLKPANILIADKDGAMRVRLVDFGSGRLIDGDVLRAFNVTDPGSLDAADSDADRSGTFAYRAPELTGDAVPTVASDVYALALIVFQLVAGDWSRTLSPGWEAAIDDSLLREDIALAGAGSPATRLASAGALADRLETLDARRKTAVAAAEMEARLAALRRAEERRVARRPWIRAAAAATLLALGITSGLAIYATHQRNQADAERRIADASYAFLAEDVLARPDPAKSVADESVMDAVKRAAASIDSRFAGRPDVGARLYLAMARAFYQRGDTTTARGAFARADALFAKAGEGTSDEAASGRLQLAQMEGMSGELKGITLGQQIVDREKAALGVRGEHGLLGFQLANAQGVVAYMTDVARSERAYRHALAIAQRDDAAVPLPMVLKAQTSLALTLMRQGKAADAEPIMRRVVARSIVALGAEHPDTLVARQNLLTSQGLQGKTEAVIAGATVLLPLLERRFGANHSYTLALHSARFESLSSLGRYGEAAIDAEKVWRGAALSSGPKSHQALGGQIDYASALCAGGDTAKGVPIAQEALANVRAAFGTDYPLSHGIAYFTAECLISAHRWADAAPLLRAVDRAKVGELIGDANWGAQVDAALAEIALGQGDRVAALKLFDAASAAAGESKDSAMLKRIADLKTRLRAD